MIRILLCALFLVGCGSDGASGPTILMDFSADTTDPDNFFHLPFPMDSRLDDQERPVMDGYPTDDNAVLAPLHQISSDRKKFPVMAVSYFQFEEDAGAFVKQTVPAELSSPVLLVNVSNNGARGTLYPVEIHSFKGSNYMPDNVLGVAPVAGVVLPANSTFSVVLRENLLDGVTLSAATEFKKILKGQGSSEHQAMFAPLLETLESLGIDDAIGANVFSTGDAVLDWSLLLDDIGDSYSVSVEGIQLASAVRYDDYCALEGTVTLPQFQKGVAPFASEGLFEFGTDGLPIMQGEDTVPVQIILPTQAMPTGGFPTLMYFHGSGGDSLEALFATGGTDPTGFGPSQRLAKQGIATVAAALPFGNERYSGSTYFDYLNIQNLAAFRDNFRQGMIEQRLLMNSLASLSIPVAVAQECEAQGLSTTESAYSLATDEFYLQGQSMGGMYSNLIGASDKRVRGLVPTGAGGIWPLMILETDLDGGSIPDLLIGSILSIDEQNWTFAHPALQLITYAWEPVEPLVSMARLGHDPLPGHESRSVFHPVGLNDIFFSTGVFDAASLATHSEQAGEEVWDSMQQNLALVERDGLQSYPVSMNQDSTGGNAYTSVVVQYRNAPGRDGHNIFKDRFEAKSQIQCFFKSLVDTGVGTVIAPQDVSLPCPN